MQDSFKADFTTTAIATITNNITIKLFQQYFSPY